MSLNPNDGHSGSDIGFSSPGAPNLSSSNSGDNDNDSDAVAVPVFFNRDEKEPEDELTISTVETAREKAMRQDSIQQGSDGYPKGAPKI